jgi:hypothetical protein
MVASKATRFERTIRRHFDAYHAADREAVEALLDPDFTFTSPYDDHIDRAAYFARCWPGAGTFVLHDLKLVAATCEGCFILYEGQAQNGEMIRNSEFIRFAGERILSIEVFFGRPTDTDTPD